MTNNVMTRGLLLVAALALTACPSGKKCATNADCAAGQVCSPMSGTCVTNNTGGGIGGGLGGGTGGGTTGGGTGGGTTGGGGGTTGGGTGGGASGGESCQSAAQITAGVIMGDTTGKAANHNVSCTGDDSPGPDAVYEISVPAGQRLDVSVAPGTVGINQYDPYVYLVEAPPSNCDAIGTDGGSAVVCLDASDDFFDSATTEVVGYLNTSGAAKTVYIVVDSYFDMDQMSDDGGAVPLAQGPFTMTVGLATPPGDDTCSGPVALTPGTPLTAQTLSGYGDDYNSASTGMGCSFGDDPDRVYSVTVPNGQRLTVNAVPEGASDLDLALNLADGEAACGESCVAAADDGFDSDPERLVYVNRTGAPQALLLIVDNWSGTGTYSLSATLDTPAGDEVCGGATMLTSGTPLTNQTTVGYSNDYEFGTNCGTGTLEGDRVYEVSVPNGQRGIVTITPQNADGGTFSPSVALVQGPAAQCDVMPRVCTASASASTAPHAAAWFNQTGMAATVFAIVDSSSASGGSFDLAFSTAAPATDDLCSTTTTTLMAGTRNDSLTGFFADYPSGTDCFSASGADRLYRVQIPANQRFTATLTPTTDGGFDPVINLVNGPSATCDMMHTCVAGADVNARNGAETMVFSNFGAAFDGYLKVSDYFGGAASTDYSLVTSLAAAPAGEACQLPQMVGAGMLLAQTTVGFSADTVFNMNAMSCEDTTGLADRVYQVSVPAGQTLTVTVTPPAGMDGGVGNQNVAVKDRKSVV